MAETILALLILKSKYYISYNSSNVMILIKITYYFIYDTKIKKLTYHQK